MVYEFPAASSALGPLIDEPSRRSTGFTSEGACEGSSSHWGDFAPVCEAAGFVCECREAALFAALGAALKEKGLSPTQVLYVGSDVEHDIVPAKRRGFRTALLLVDTATAKVKPADLKDEKTKPNVLLTAFEQIAAIVPNAA